MREEGANIIVSISSLMNNEMAFLIFRVGVGCYQQHAAFERETAFDTLNNCREKKRKEEKRGFKINNTRTKTLRRRRRRTPDDDDDDDI